MSAKFSVNYINGYTVTSCKTVVIFWPYDALTTKHASIVSLTPFFYYVIPYCRPFHARNGLYFADFWRVLGNVTIKIWSAIVQSPKRHFLALLRVILAIVRVQGET